jgi:hypothetical protein
MCAETELPDFMLHQRLPNLTPGIARVVRHVTALVHQLAGMLGAASIRLQALVSNPAKQKSNQGPSTGRVARRKPPLLIHYHIFKNAGSSFQWALEQALGRGYRSLDSPSPRGFVSRCDLIEFSKRHPDACAISSHQAAPPAPKIRGREVLTSILIRDPIARVRSIYAFERSQQALTPGAIKAKELTFKEYVEWRLRTSPTMFCNYQVHFCTRSARGPSGPPDRQRLEAAIANLDAIDIVGTVTRYNEWIALAENILAAAFPNLALPSVRRNVTAGGDLTEAVIFERLQNDLGESTAQYLLRNNELDMCLHQVADALLTRRLAERGVGLFLLQAYTDKQYEQPSSKQLSELS